VLLKAAQKESTEKMTTQPLAKNTKMRDHHRQRITPDGALVEFLASPDEVGGGICLIRGTVRPGGVVPLHSHADFEIFYVLDGSIEAFQSRNGASQWTTVGAGDVVTVPGNTKHAWRNSSPLPAKLLVVTTPKMHAFFNEITRPFDPSHPAIQPTPEGIHELFRTAARYGHWMGSPEGNAAIGLSRK
jgi:quercetin dioxygenase-like cupin family protein